MLEAPREVRSAALGLLQRNVRSRQPVRYRDVPGDFLASAHRVRQGQNQPVVSGSIADVEGVQNDIFTFCKVFGQRLLPSGFNGCRTAGSRQLVQLQAALGDVASGAVGMDADFGWTAELCDFISRGHIVDGDAAGRIVVILDVAEFLDEFIACLIDGSHMDRVAARRQTAVCAGQTEGSAVRLGAVHGKLRRRFVVAAFRRRSFHRDRIRQERRRDVIVGDAGKLDERIAFCRCLAGDALTGAVLQGEFFCSRDLAVYMNDPGGNRIASCAGCVDSADVYFIASVFDLRQLASRCDWLVRAEILCDGAFRTGLVIVFDQLVLYPRDTRRIQPLPGDRRLRTALHIGRTDFDIGRLGGSIRIGHHQTRSSGGGSRPASYERGELRRRRRILQHEAVIGAARSNALCIRKHVKRLQLARRLGSRNRRKGASRAPRTIVIGQLGNDPAFGDLVEAQLLPGCAAAGLVSVELGAGDGLTGKTAAQADELHVRLIGAGRVLAGWHDYRAALIEIHAAVFRSADDVSVLELAVAAPRQGRIDGDRILAGLVGQVRFIHGHGQKVGVLF